MEMTITFEGKKKIIADYHGHTIITDQPIEAGGDGSAPAPFDLFLASIGTCAGIYVKSFCDQRNIPSDKIKITQKMEFDFGSRLISRISLDIILPDGFPEKYKEAVVNVANLCAVKKHFISPPKIDVAAVVS